MGSVALEGFGSGGAALNFKVVPGLTQPGTAVENTIWVKTEKIGSWYFSATQPEEMQEWDVWFQTGAESDYAFNALRKNAVQVYPLSAKQMISGSLVDVTAMSYQNGEWVNWWNGELYDKGNEFTGYTGGWVSYAQTTGTVSKNNNRLTINCTTMGDGATAIGTDEKVDLHKATKLFASVISHSGASIRFTITSEKYTNLSSINPASIASVDITKEGVIELPFTGVSSAYISFANIWNPASNTVIDEVWMK